MKLVSLFFIFTMGLILSSTAIASIYPPAKLVSKNVHIQFYSHTDIEDITANNYQVTATLDTETGKVVFSVPMQGFEFEKALMQKHYNSSKFLDTKKHPKSKMTGKIKNLGAIDFKKDGTYPAQIEGEMTIKGKTNPIQENGTIVVKDGKIAISATFPITLSDYGVEFVKGKPSKNIAKTVEVRVKGEF
jgi:polyisoprenoid-binding protein YceI